MKRDFPSHRGPILTHVQPAPSQEGSGSALTQEDRERKTKEEQLVLEGMRALTTSNSSLGFDEMFWASSSTSRPPDGQLASLHHQTNDAMQQESQEHTLLHPPPANNRLLQPTPTI